MFKHLSVEFFYQVFALILAAILVHGIYVSVIRPRAAADLEQEQALLAQQPDAEIHSSLYVVLKDYEQEACFILMVWALAILGYKGVTVLRERRLLDDDLLPMADGIKILPEDAPQYGRRMDSLRTGDRSLLLPRAIYQALTRFATTRNVQDVSASTRALCENEGERMDSDLALIRYIAWAIPSIGFLGTVRGIGNALGQAHRAVEGDITGVTQSLGTAFNSTLIALLISIVLMFLVHQLQLAQERLVLDTETYLNDRLIRHLRTA
jgi:biopolymer transport protein ExbB/TolQ